MVYRDNAMVNIMNISDNFHEKGMIEQYEKKVRIYGDGIPKDLTDLLTKKGFKK